MSEKPGTKTQEKRRATIQPKGQRALHRGVKSGSAALDRSTDQDSLLAGRTAVNSLPSQDTAAPVSRESRFARDLSQVPTMASQGVQLTPAPPVQVRARPEAAVQRDNGDEAQAARIRTDTFGQRYRQRLGSLIEQLAGAEGTELEINVTVRIPVYHVLNVSGSIQLQVAHEPEGYKVLARPALGLSVGRSTGTGGGYVDLMANYTVEAQAASGSRVAEMISLAFEQEVRNMRDEPPPLIISAVMGVTGAAMPGLTAAASLMDLVDRAVNYARGEGWVSSFWPDLADALWGEGHSESVMRGMREGEYAQSLDEGSIGGQASGGEGLEASVSGRIGVGQRRRTERRAGEASAQEREDIMFRLKLNVGISSSSAGGGGEVDLNIPLTQGARGGKAKFAINVTFSTRSLGAWNTALRDLETVLRVAIRQIQRYRQQGGQGAQSQALTDAQSRLERGASQVQGIFSEAVMNRAWGALGQAGVADHGFEINAELNLDSNQWKFQLVALDQIEESGAGQAVSITRKRVLFEHTTS